MHIGHHGGHPAHVEVLAARAFFALQTLVHVAFDGFGPVAHVAHVDGEFLGVRRHLHVFLDQHKRALLAVEREHHHARAHRQHEGGLWAVEAVARRDLLAAFLQKVLFGHGVTTFGFFEHAEDGADAHVDVDVGRAVERVKHQQVFALGVAVGHDVDGFHLFAGHGRQVTAPFVGLDQHLVGDDVELLLHLALHVLATSHTQDAGQVALAHGLADALASPRHHLEQQTQLGGDVAVFALLFDEVAGEGDALAHGGLSVRGCSKRGQRPRAHRCSSWVLRPRVQSPPSRRCGRARPTWPSGPWRGPSGPRLGG